MIVLGITAYFHDSSICLIKDGKIIFAIEEERLTRIKHDSSFPSNSIKEALRYCQISSSEVDEIIFFEKPFLKFERLLETYLSYVPRGFQSFVKAIPLWINEKLFQKKIIIRELIKIGFLQHQVDKIYFSEHHLSHASSAFYPSPFKEAVILTIDGVGEWATTSVSIGRDNKILKIKEIHFPHSLGMFYSAFTYYCGFKVNSGEYKLMGLAPYGEPKYSAIIKDKIIKIFDDGSFILNMEYFDYCTGLTMTNKKFDKLFGLALRIPESKIEKIHLDLAASAQVVIEEVILKICKNIRSEFGIENLCLAGGVALNCVANGKIYKEKIFKNIFIQPAAGDAGCAIGAALALYYDHFKNIRKVDANDSMNGSFLGSCFSDTEIESSLRKYNFKKIF